MIKVNFMRSEDNTVDILTKNVSVELFQRHIQKLIIDKDDLESEDSVSSGRKGVAGMPPQTDLSRDTQGHSYTHDKDGQTNLDTDDHQTG